VVGDMVKAFGRHIATTRDVLQERPYLLGPFRPTERQQQDRIEIH
jgi:hypothetical protein